MRLEQVNAYAFLDYATSGSRAPKDPELAWHTEKVRRELPKWRRNRAALARVTDISVIRKDEKALRDIVSALKALPPSTVAALRKHFAGKASKVAGTKGKGLLSHRTEPQIELGIEMLFWAGILEKADVPSVYLTFPFDWEKVRLSKRGAALFFPELFGGKATVLPERAAPSLAPSKSPRAATKSFDLKQWQSRVHSVAASARSQAWIEAMQHNIASPKKALTMSTAIKLKRAGRDDKLLEDRGGQPWGTHEYIRYIVWDANDDLRHLALITLGSFRGTAYLPHYEYFLRKSPNPDNQTTGLCGVALMTLTGQLDAKTFTRFLAKAKPETRTRAKRFFEKHGVKEAAALLA